MKVSKIKTEQLTFNGKEITVEYNNHVCCVYDESGLLLEAIREQYKGVRDDLIYNSDLDEKTVNELLTELKKLMKIN